VRTMREKGCTAPAPAPQEKKKNVRKEKVVIEPLQARGDKLAKIEGKGQVEEKEGLAICSGIHSSKERASPSWVRGGGEKLGVKGNAAARRPRADISKREGERKPQSSCPVLKKKVEESKKRRQTQSPEEKTASAASPNM